MIFILRNEEVLENCIKYLEEMELDEDKPFELRIKSHKVKRTENQNSLYWSWMRVISRNTGDSDNSLHTYYGNEFLPKEEAMVMGKKVITVKSTTSLGTKDFTEYLNKIEAHASTFLGIMLPHPGDLEW